MKNVMEAGKISSVNLGGLTCENKGLQHLCYRHLCRQHKRNCKRLTHLCLLNISQYQKPCVPVVIRITGRKEKKCVDKELFRNGSGYVDITAYEALKNIEKENSNMEFNRGEIFEYEEVGRAIPRKALIISADFRTNERWQSIILLSEEPKGKINVPIVCEGKQYADCGMVSFAVTDRLGRYIRTATASEMAQIDEGVAKCLGIEQKTVEVPVEKVVEVPAQYPSETHLKTAEVLAKAKTEASIYKNLYEQLLAKVMG